MGAISVDWCPLKAGGSLRPRANIIPPSTPTTATQTPIRELEPSRHGHKLQMTVVRCFTVALALVFVRIGTDLAVDVAVLVELGASMRAGVHEAALVRAPAPHLVQATELAPVLSILPS